MATKAALTITWSSSGSVSVAAGGTATSDPFTLADDCEIADVLVACDNDGTPASGDTVTVKALASYDGSNYATAQNAAPAAVIDTYSTNGEDPGRKRVPLSPAATNYVLHVTNNSAGRAITVSATGNQITTS